MYALRPWFALPVAFALAGCQPLAPGTSQQLVRSNGSGDELQVESRDDDTLSGRLSTSGRQVSEVIAKPFDPANRQAQAARREQEKRQAAAKKAQQQPQRSALANWFFPEPKQPRTLSEWLSQERP